MLHHFRNRWHSAMHSATRGGAHFAASVTAVLLAVGCAPAPAVKPVVVPAPEVPRVEVPAAPAETRLTIPTLVTDTHYRVETRTELERDSAGRRETQKLSAQAQVTVRLRRQPNGGFTATGRLSGYATTSPFPNSTAAPDSLQFTAMLDSMALRVVLDPPLANECDQPETGALTLVRDLFARVPSTLTIGATWRDSTVQIVCRSSLPMIVRTTADYVVTDTTHDDAGIVVLLRRSTQTRVEGKTASPWRALEVTGSGTGALDIRVSVVSGAVTKVSGNSTLTLTMTERTSTTTLRSQQVIQRVQVTGSATPR
jgi:hypothetical protein